MSYAEQAASDVYDGKRPTGEDFKAMNEKWDLAEQAELYYLVFSTFDTKYYKNHSSGEGIYLEFGGVGMEALQEPVDAILEGKKVVVKGLETRLVEVDNPWYSIDSIDIKIT